MPFKSQSQRRKFYAMASRGEISKNTLRKWEKATPKGKELPEKKAEMKKLARAIAIEIEKNASLVKLLAGLLSKAKAAPTKVKSLAKALPKDEAVAFKLGLISPLPGGSVLGWGAYKGGKEAVKALKHGPPLSNYRKMNKAVERSRRLHGDKIVGDSWKNYKLVKSSSALGVFLRPSLAKQAALGSSPIAQKFNQNSSVVAGYDSQASLPSYNKGGKIKKDGYLTDEKGRPYARVHKGERVVPKRRAA